MPHWFCNPKAPTDINYIFFNFKEIEPEGQDSESTCSPLSPVQGKKPFCNIFETKPSSNPKLPTFGVDFEDLYVSVMWLVIIIFLYGSDYPEGIQYLLLILNVIKSDVQCLCLIGLMAMGMIISCIISFFCKGLLECLFVACLLLQPSEHLGAVLPDNDATFELFDRVVNVKLNAAVPFGLRGTIVGIHQGICTCINFRGLCFPLQISDWSENGREK